jgi:threonine synthase
MFRYLPFLPIDPSARLPSLFVGGTPLTRVTTSDFAFNLWVKDEGRNPTASLKDRASALVCSKAVELGFDTITTASSGNAAAATSAMACNLGLKCVIFVPKCAPVAKVLQNRVFGSKVFLVDGDYDTVVRACMAASLKFGWYNRSTAFNPFTIDGKKTVVFEICEQLAAEKGSFRAPDVVAVSVGDGNIISAVHKGLTELVGAKLIGKMPRILGVQPEGSNPICRCFMENGDETNIKPSDAATCADSLACGNPSDPIRAVRAARQTNGAFVDVSEDEILNAIADMSMKSGIFPEPAAAAAWAGIAKAERLGLIQKNKDVVMILTGNGLKDIQTGMRAMEGKNEAVTILTADEIDPATI